MQQEIIDELVSALRFYDDFPKETYGDWLNRMRIDKGSIAREALARYESSLTSEAT